MGGAVDGGYRWRNKQDTHTILLTLRPCTTLSPSIPRPLPAPAAADCLNETNRLAECRIMSTLDPKARGRRSRERRRDGRGELQNMCLLLCSLLVSLLSLLSLFYVYAVWGELQNVLQARVLATHRLGEGSTHSTNNWCNGEVGGISSPSDVCAVLIHHWSAPLGKGPCWHSHRPGMK